MAKSSARWLQCDELTSAPLREKHKKIIYTQLIILSIDQIIFLGIAGYIDRKVLQPSHMFDSPTCKNIYNTVVPYDPEGKKSIKLKF